MTTSIYTAARQAGSTKTAAQLLSLADDLDLDLKYTELPVRIRRTRAGHWQLAAGVWSWVLMDNNHREIIASIYTVREILTAHRNGTTKLYCHPFRMDTPEVFPS